MVSGDSFSEEALTDLFKNNLKLNTQNNIKYLIEKCSTNENILCLKVASKNEDFDLKFFMVMVSDNEKFSKKTSDYPKPVENIFSIRDKNEDLYFGFSTNGILVPSRNNIKDLTIILKSLAELHANSLSDSRKKDIKYSEYHIRNMFDDVLRLDYFKSLDNIDLDSIASNLQKSINDLFRDGFVVESLGCASGNQVFIKDSGKCIFLELEHKAYRSPVYDVLTYIFALSDESFRQHHLKTLLNLYYQTFVGVLEKIDLTTASSFNVNVFESHIKIVLPIVKFETAAHLSKKETKIQDKQQLPDLLRNILYCLRYQQASYEDCLEALSNRLGSTHFELIDYRFVPLNERDGHLGDYFKLNCQINSSGKTEEFNMFSKTINAELVQSGASKKEQFFFRTLVPLFKEYGLESLLDFAPKCYFDRLNDIVILENLAEFNYTSFRSNDCLGYDSLKLAYLEAAKLHACSLILEHRMSERQGKTIRLGDIYGEFMEDWLFETYDGKPTFPVRADLFKPGLDQFIDSFSDIVKDISLEEFHKRVNALYDVFIERMNYPAKQFRNVVCHGDFYACNILFKYDQNNQAESCRLVDFQALRYVPMAQDILMLVYCNTEKQVRDKYLNQLLEDYYQELRRITFDFDLDMDIFFTHDKFTDCVKYMKPVMLLAAINCSHILSLPPEVQQDVYFDKEKFQYYLIDNKKEFVNYALSVSEIFKIHMKGLIEDLYDVCLNS